MPPGNGNGGGKPGGGGGDNSTPFAITGLDDASDGTAPGEDTTTLQTGFVIVGTIDPALLTDPNFSLIIVINGTEYEVPEENIDGGTWSYTYGSSVEPPSPPLSGSVTVEAYYTSTHPKNGKIQEKQAVNTYPFTIEDDGAGNNAPTAVNDDVSTNEDVTINGNVLLNDTDPDGDPLTVTGFEIGGTNYGAGDTANLAEGDLTLNANGSWTFVPAPNFNGPVPGVIYTVSDGTSSSTATLSITVNPVNDDPTAVNDTATTGQGQAVEIDVLANDSDIDGDSPTINSATNGGNGTVTVNPDGTITYTPNAGFSGQDSFTYTIIDGNGGSDQGTVTVTVNGINGDPDAVNDSATTEENNAVIISVLQNDTDPENDQLSVTQVTQGANGSVVINANGTVTYTPDAGYIGQDSFTYTISDGNGGSDVATVTVDVTAAPPPPVGDGDPTNDPLYGDQWHLAMLGDIEAIWADFTGAGVSVGVYDNGVEWSHEDLVANYDPTKHVWVNGSQIDPAPGPNSTAEHGTSVSGVIAGSNNTVGGVGVAWGAMLTGINVFGGPADINAHLNGGTVNGFAEAMNQAYTFDIINNSWGAAPDFNNETDAAILAALSAFETAVQTGRGGLGTLIVKAVGNDWDNAQGDYLNTSRYTISVAAHDEDGDASWYTNRGANVLVSAPSSGSSADADRGIVTTDLTDSEGNINDDQGYSNGNYTDAFGGTSSATPVVSGVIALMLDANDALGWRDVQSILAYSAHYLGGDPGETAPVPESGGGTVAFPVDFFDWVNTATTNWNGGAQTFSEDYGFGGVDAYNAVRMAEVWSLFRDAQDSSNEISYVGALQSPELRFLMDPVSASFTISQAEADAIGMRLEYVEVYLGFSTAHFYSRLGDISVNLISASGTSLSLIQAVNPNGSPDDWTGTNDFLPFGGDLGGSLTWTFGITALRDEDLAGDWRIEIYDVNAELGESMTGGTLHDIQFTFYGSAASSDDVYHYTDEVFGLLTGLANDPRLSLSDTSGNDWLNMAALAGNLTVNLANDASGGASDSVQGTFLSFADGSQIENVVTGDGNDTITGNDADNELGGMRGNDVLLGMGGNDLFWFFVGTGQDWVGDFADGFGEEDLIGLNGFGFTSISDFGISQNGADAVLDLGGGDMITLANFDSGLLGDDDFVFV